jgi:hypothetical protein
MIMLSAAAANLSYVGRRLLRLLFTLAAGVTLAGQSLTRSSIQPQPIIDVHLHAYAPADWKGPSPNPVTGKAGPATAEEHMRQTLAAMERFNIVKAIVSGPVEVVEQWRADAPRRIVASPLFGRPDVDLYGARYRRLTNYAACSRADA